MKKIIMRTINIKMMMIKIIKNIIVEMKIMMTTMMKVMMIKLNFDLY